MKNIQDGTAEFEVKDMRYKAIVDLIYPVGTIVPVANDSTPIFTKYGTWEKCAAGRVLQGTKEGESPGTDVEAGLPNITGYFYNQGAKELSRNGEGTYSDPFYPTVGAQLGGQTSSGTTGVIWNFDASKSNEIYGNSDTVQPPAHLVVFWKRIK